ncbi:MAG TPA: cob(I)yrinic acid a,c-diamide adenosyltransferase [Clostridia bacterium]
MLSQGMIHMYIGDGKGKTTAAVGLAVRALGTGLKVLFVQFLKNTITGEKNILEKFTEKLYFYRPEQRHHLFLWKMTEKQLAETKEDLQAGWKHVREEILSGKWDVVVLDEILDVIGNGLLSEEDIANVLIKRPAKTEIICTGRDAPDSLRDLADYISLIEKVKHPYDMGVRARYGIEY